MEIIAAKFLSDDHPDKPHQFEILRLILEQCPVQEICLLDQSGALNLFAVAEDPEEAGACFAHHLPTDWQHSGPLLMNRKAVRRFIDLYLGKGSPLIGEPRLQASIHKELLEYQNEGFTGAVFRKLRTDAERLLEDLRKTTELINHSVTPEALSLELTGKIVENVAEANITIIEGPQSSGQFLIFWISQTARKLYYCSSDFQTTSHHVLNENIHPVHPDELTKILLSTDVIVLASVNQKTSSMIGQALRKRLQKKIKHLLIFNWADDPGLRNISTGSSSVFAYNRDELNDALERGRARRQQIISRSEPRIDQMVEKVIDWFYSAKRYQFHGMIGQSRKMQQVFDLIQRVAGTDVTVLIQGETGTGKELIARAIHGNSQRKHGQFMAINCGAIPETLLESELFGHEKGAFTGATETRKGLLKEAAGGTVFLDELGETSKLFQVKLLRALQEREITPLGSSSPESIDVRIIAATSKDLQEEVEYDRFRPDLYYRINVVKITLPPLRDRPEDILPLTFHFMQVQNRIFGKSVEKITPEAVEALKNYTWPGNVRELENAVERAIALNPANTITLDELPAVVEEVPRTSPEQSNRGVKTLEEIEKDYIEKLLRDYPENYNQVADMLGIGRTTLWRKMKKYGLERD